MFEVSCGSISRYSLASRSRPSDAQQGGSPIGRPIPDLRLYLLDAHRQPVPLGAVGELHVGGDGV
ncbi:hypothetical protein PPH41_10165, partial [Burkholderia gladioli]|nr:hypothetical protein [Burkholderia gladioli]